MTDYQIPLKLLAGIGVLAIYLRWQLIYPAGSKLRTKDHSRWVRAVPISLFTLTATMLFVSLIVGDGHFKVVFAITCVFGGLTILFGFLLFRRRV